MNTRQEIEQAKNKFRQDFKQEMTLIERAIVRYVYNLWKRSGGNLDQLARLVLEQFDLKEKDKQRLINEIKSTQWRISVVWDDYFHGFESDFEPRDYERLAALYYVDFPEIAAETKNTVIEEIRRAARSGYGFETLRSRLLKRGLGDAYTLANTAVAQFDNAYMFENALQGGIIYYKYGGVLHKNSRPFCKRELYRANVEGVIYTMQEIEQMDNGQGLPVKTSCGGYNCTHYWNPVLRRNR